MDNTTNREDLSSQSSIITGSHVPNGCIKHCGLNQEQLFSSDPDSERVGVLDYMYVKPSLRHTTTTTTTRESQFKTYETSDVVSNCCDLKEYCLSSSKDIVQQQQQQQSFKQLEQNIELKTFSIKEQYNNCTDGSSSSSRTGSSRGDSFRGKSRQFSASDDDVELLDPMDSEEILREVVVHDDGIRSFHRMTPARNTTNYDYVIDGLGLKSYEDKAPEINCSSLHFNQESTSRSRFIPSSGATRIDSPTADHSSSSSAQDNHFGCAIPVIGQSPPADISISRAACSTYTLSPNDNEEVAMETDESSCYQDIYKNQTPTPSEINNDSLIRSEMSADLTCLRVGSEIVNLDKNHLDISARSNVLYLNDYSFWNGANRGGLYRDSDAASYLNERAEVTKRLQRRDQKKKRLDGHTSKAEDVAEYKGRLTVEEIVAFINDDDDKKRKGGATTTTRDRMQQQQQERKKKRKNKRDDASVPSVRGDDASDEDDEATKSETTGNSSSEMTSKLSSDMIDNLTSKSSFEIIRKSSLEKKVKPAEHVETAGTFGDAASLATAPLITAATAAVKSLNLSTLASQASSAMTSVSTASSATSPTCDISPTLNSTYSTGDHETTSISPPESVFSNFSEGQYSEGNPNYSEGYYSEGQPGFYEGHPVVMETEFKVVGPRKQKLKNTLQRLLPLTTYDVTKYPKRAPLPPPKRSNDFGGKGRTVNASRGFKETTQSNSIECDFNFPDLSGAALVRRGSLGNSPSDASKKDFGGVDTTGTGTEDKSREGVTSYAHIAASGQCNKRNSFSWRVECRRRSLESSQLQSDVTVATYDAARRELDGGGGRTTHIRQDAQSPVQSGSAATEAASASDAVGKGCSASGNKVATSSCQNVISQPDVSGVEPGNAVPLVTSDSSITSVRVEVRSGAEKSSILPSSITTATFSQDLISSKVTSTKTPNPKRLSASSGKKNSPIVDASKNKEKQKRLPSKAVVFYDEENDADVKRERFEVSFLFDPNEFIDQTTIENPIVTSGGSIAGVVIASQSTNAGGGAQEKGMSTDSATSPIAESEFENRLDATYRKSMPSAEVSPSNRVAACANAAPQSSVPVVVSYNSRPIAPLSGSGFSPGVKTPVVVVSPLQFERETSGSSQVQIQNVANAADQTDLTILKDTTVLCSRTIKRLDHDVVESEPLLEVGSIPAQRNEDLPTSTVEQVAAAATAIETLRKRGCTSSFCDDRNESTRQTFLPNRSSCGGKGRPLQAALNVSDEPVRSGNFNLVTAQLFVYQEYQNVLKIEKYHSGSVTWF